MPLRLPSVSMRTAILSFVFLLSLSRISVAEPPAIKAVSPPGVQRGQQVELTLTGKPGTLPLKVEASCEGFVTLTPSEKGDKLTVETSPDCPLGIHWLRFFNDEGAASLVPLWVGSLPETSETEPNNSLDEATTPDPILLPSVINGVLHKGGEVDTFRIQLRQGETVVASLDAHEGLASPMDSVLQIVDANGFVVAQNHDDHGLDPLIHFSADRDGDYFVRVFAFPSAPNSSIVYAGGADYVYRLTLTNGPFVTAMVPAIEEASAATFSTSWKLDGEDTSRLNELPGLHHRHRRSKVDLTAQTLATPAEPLDIPSSVVGVILKPEESISVPVQLAKGTSIVSKVFARRLDSLLDPVLTVRDADGKALKTADDISKENLDAELSWKAPADGVFTFEITDRYGHVGERYFAVLQMEEDLPRFELSVAEDHFEVPKDKPLEVAVTVNRLAGYKGEIQVSIPTLPEGITCEPVVSPGDGDTAKKVTLKLDAAPGTTFQGGIQIAGEDAGNSLKSLATASLKLSEWSTDSVWITAIRPPAAPEKPEEDAEEKAKDKTEE
ncbi:MAG: PPC domain-containing protein [Planctomycetaceae bacterium]|nr:PPC domain-containing protein [Planctomycetaceae bacterium]